MGSRAHLAPHLAGAMGIHRDVSTIDGCTQARRLGDFDRHCRAPTFARMIFRQAVRFSTLWGALSAASSVATTASCAAFYEWNARTQYCSPPSVRQPRQPLYHIVWSSSDILNFLLLAHHSSNCGGTALAAELGTDSRLGDSSNNAPSSDARPYWRTLRHYC